MSSIVIKSLEIKLFFKASHVFFLPIKFETKKQVALKPYFFNIVKA